MSMLKGHCECKSVTFEAPRADSIETCHCDMCRRITGGGSYFGMSCHDGITITSCKTLSWYDSSAWAQRGFCSICGTALFYNLKGSEFYSVSVGTLDTPPELPLGKEYFIDRKPNYYALEGDRPRFTAKEVMSGVAQGNDQGQNDE